MKANQLATLLLRLMGIYFLLETLAVIPTYGNAFSEEMKYNISMAIETLGSLLTNGVIGILLIVLSAPLGKKLVSTDPGEEGISAITFKQAQVLAFAIVGVLILAAVLPQLLPCIFNLLRSGSTPDYLHDSYLTYRYTSPGTTRLLVESSIGLFLKTALGLWLFLGTEGFANFWSSLRNFATPKPPQSQ